jgi:hypothetical protein
MVKNLMLVAGQMQDALLMAGAFGALCKWCGCSGAII